MDRFLVPGKVIERDSVVITITDRISGQIDYLIGEDKRSLCFSEGDMLLEHGQDYDDVLLELIMQTI